MQNHVIVVHIDVFKAGSSHVLSINNYGIYVPFERNLLSEFIFSLAFVYNTFVAGGLYMTLSTKYMNDVYEKLCAGWMMIIDS